MKILYGVQGTGNGHITRARAIAAALKKHPEIDVTWLFSGRAQKDFFDMDIFGDYQWRHGLSFVTENGRVNNLKTLMAIKPKRLIADIQSLNIEQYDLIATDYEPVSAWAARLAKRDVIGIGHQYAFNYDIPVTGENLITSAIMRFFAPANISLGLHWHHFGHPILPPIAEIHGDIPATKAKQVLVYLPFENPQRVIELLKPLTPYEFYVYCPGLADTDRGHIHTRKACFEGFQNDLKSSQYVISNSGFELISESLLLGKSILTKPVKGQMEQQSNALALHKLGLATVIHAIDTTSIEQWLSNAQTISAIDYPNVAQEICEWLIDPNRGSAQSLSEKLWSQTRFNNESASTLTLATHG